MTVSLHSVQGLVEMLWTSLSSFQQSVYPNLILTSMEF